MRFGFPHTVILAAAACGLVPLSACDDPTDDEAAAMDYAPLGSCTSNELSRPSASASSQVNTGRSPAKAIDGSASSFWESRSCAGEWLRVDLGGPKWLEHVTIDWAYNWPTSYRLEVLSASGSWATVYNGVATGDGIDTLPDVNVVAQSVRVTATACSGATVTINEIRFYGDDNPDCGGVGPVETCFDGIQNQDETGVDCGGVCAPCGGGGGNDSCETELAVIAESVPTCGGYPANDTTCYTRLWEDEFRTAQGTINFGEIETAGPNAPTGTSRWTIAFNGTWPDNGCVSSRANVSLEPDPNDPSDEVLALRVRSTPNLALSGWSYYDDRDVTGQTKQCTFSEVRLRDEVGPYGFFEASLDTPNYGSSKERASYIVGMFSFNFDDDASPDLPTGPGDLNRPVGYKKPWLEFDHELVQNQPAGTLNSLISSSYVCEAVAPACDIWGCTWHQDNAYQGPANFNHKSGFHKYGLEWTPTHLRYWVDEVLTWELTRDQVESAAANDIQARFPHQPLQMIFNFWMSNAGFGGTFKPSDFPAIGASYDMNKYGARVDWARWYDYVGPGHKDAPRP